MNLTPTMLGGLKARAVILGLAVTCGSVMTAQDRPDVLTTRAYEYSAKFVCKNAANDVTDSSFAFGPAYFRTVLNLHNQTNRPAKLRIRAVEARGLGNTLPNAVGRIEHELEGDDALYIDCNDVWRILNAPDPVRRVDGYVIVESTLSLDVDAVYTSVTRRIDAVAEHASIDVEEIPGRIVSSSIATTSTRPAVNAR